VSAVTVSAAMDENPAEHENSCECHELSADHDSHDVDRRQPRHIAVLDDHDAHRTYVDSEA
jgi:hypothetical protein